MTHSLEVANDGPAPPAPVPELAPLALDLAPSAPQPPALALEPAALVLESPILVPEPSALTAEPAALVPEPPAAPPDPASMPPRPAAVPRALGGPARGFGSLWEKTYTMTLEGISPQAAIASWQRRFPWPASRRDGRGVTRLYGDAESVTVSTLPAEPFAGWITVCAESAGLLTDVRVHILMRARDPLTELGFALGGRRRHDIFWVSALSSLARQLSLPDPPIMIRGVRLDSRRQWRNLRNIRHCPAVRTLARTVTLHETGPCGVAGSGASARVGQPRKRGRVGWRGRALPLSMM